MEEDELLEDALNYYKASAKKKNILAISKLIELEWESEYETDIDIEIDFELDVKWIREAAIHGNSDAQYLLGSMYFYGIDVNEDEEKALKWLKLSANNGNSKAISDIKEIEESRRLEETWKIEQAANNAAKNLKVTKERAEKGGKNAAFELGRIYEFGLGVDTDMKAAMEWYQRADRLGYHLYSGYKNVGYYYYYSIAQAYHFGVKVTENIHLAKENYRLAFNNGYEKAREIVENLQ